MNSEEFSNTIYNIANDRLKATDYMKSLMNPPKGYDEAYINIKALYDTYLRFTSLTINPTGSYDSYFAELSNLDNDMVNNYNATLIYVDFQ